MKKIKLFDPTVGFEEEKALIRTLRSHMWASGSGSGLVLKFESEFRKYLGTDECIAVNSATAALHLALSLMNIRGKEVILPSLSFVSTAHAVVYNGGKPVFVDVDPISLCIDPTMIKKSITKKTRVILPVHFGGMPCNLDEIISVCKEKNIVLIEDAAHGAGSFYKKTKIGTHGSAVCFSFHPIKNLAMPLGGAITLNGKNSRKYAKKLKSLRWCGIANRRGAKYDVIDVGWNYYMSEFSASIGLEQLKKLDKMNNKRKRIAKRYAAEIDIEQKMPFNKECSYHLYWIQVKNRDGFMKKMTKNNIETGIHYRPIHTMKAYKGKTSLKITEKVSKNIVSLPIYPNLSDYDVSKIIKLTNLYSK